MPKKPLDEDDDTVSATFRLTARQRAELEAEAKKRGLSLSALIREKIEASDTASDDPARGVILK